MELRVLGSWGLVLLCFITEMNRNDRSITEIFFLLELLAGAWRSLVWVGGALQNHFLLRSKSGPLFGSLVWGWIVWRWLLQKWTEMTEALQKFSFYWRVLVLGLGGRLYWLEKHYRNYSLSLIFCYGKKKKTSFLFTCS